MNQVFKYLLFSIAFFLFSEICHAQTTDQLSIQQSTDSALRIVLKDSLNIGDADVSQIFAVRDSLFKKTQTIRNHTGLTVAEQNEQITALRSQTNDDIKTILGQPKYEKYLDMIRRKLTQRT